MRRGAIAVFALVLGGRALAQDLPPDVLLLARVKTHLADEFKRLTSITCLETVEREVGAAAGKKMTALDTVRLEVLTTAHKELFASPGDRKFSEDHPANFAGAGMLSDGLFGQQLKNILLNGNASSEYKGVEDIGGRHLVHYDFRLPVLFSGYSIQIPEGSGRVGLRGSFWVDQQTFDIARLETQAVDFPPTLPVREASTRIRYELVPLGDAAPVLLPTTAEVTLVKTSGAASHNRIEFTHCRRFSSESVLSFDDARDSTPRFGAASTDDALRPLPAGLQIRVRLRSPISANTSVGELVEGVVAGDVTAKRIVVIPLGSPVRGRVRRLEHYTDPFSYFVVGLEFTEVEIDGVRHLFYAGLMDTDAVPGLEPRLSLRGIDTRNPVGGGFDTVQTLETIYAHDLPGVATFFFRGSKLELPENFGTQWKTRAWKP